MNKRIIRLLSLIFCLALALNALPFAASAAEAEAIEAEYSGFSETEIGYMLDGKEATYSEYTAGTEIKVNAGKSKIAQLYIEFYDGPVKWSIEGNGKSEECGKNSFLHEYVDVASAIGECGELTLKFEEKANVSEFSVYTAGQTPSTVQKWEPPCEKADLVMFSSHADDEQLFFSGVLPYSVAKGAAVQVVYFCSHFEEQPRPHEQLNGLWAVGVKNYPVFGIFPDLFSESLEEAEQVYGNSGYKYEDYMTWQVENIRRFKPQILVGHDIYGEYGHGTHLLNSKTMLEAVDAASDEGKYPESAKEYGVWDTPKVYVHLYGENKITLDFDTPLEYFGGRTAYEMSCEGFNYHKSQHWTWFYDWMYGKDEKFTKATQITTYSPCEWGLYRTLVGNDTGNDMFENITLYNNKAEEAPQTDAETETAAETAAGKKKESEREESSGILPVFLTVLAVLIIGFIIFTAVALYKDNKRKKRRKKKRPVPGKRPEQK